MTIDVVRDVLADGDFWGGAGSPCGVSPITGSTAGTACCSRWGCASPKPSVSC